MKNYIQEGDCLNYTATADIDSGDMVVMTDLVGIAVTDIAEDAVGAVCIKGVFEVTKKTTDVVTIGQKLYFETGAARLTTDADDGEAEPAAYVLAGYAAAPAGNTATKVQVRLIG